MKKKIEELNAEKNKLKAQIEELNEKLSEKDKDLDFKQKKIDLLEESQQEQHRNNTKFIQQIEELKMLNTRLMEKCEEFKNMLQKAKKQHAKELEEKLKQAQGSAQERESEIQVLKEMIKGVKMQLKSKDTDI